MMAGDAQCAGGAKQRDAFTRLGVVADDIAEADDAIGPVGGNVVERCRQRLGVGVNFGNERELHGLARSRFGPALLCGLAASAVDFGEGAARRNADSDTDPRRERTLSASRHSQGVCLM